MLPNTTLDALNELLVQFQGFHSFHNFTHDADVIASKTSLGFGEIDIKKETHTLSRIILSCRCDDVVKVENEEFYKVSIVGMSFLRYQIRKMVGLVIHILRGNLPSNYLEWTLQTRLCVPLPRAPGTNLIKSSGGLRDRQHSGHIVNFNDPEISKRQQAFAQDQIYPEIALLSRNAFLDFDTDGQSYTNVSEDKLKIIEEKSKQFVEEKKNKDEYLHRKDSRKESRLLPRQFVINYMIEFERVPGWKNEYLVYGLEDAIECGEIEAMKDKSYYFDFIEEQGEETLIERGQRKITDGKKMADDRSDDFTTTDSIEHENK
jgi:hypothetical protein